MRPRHLWRAALALAVALLAPQIARATCNPGFMGCVGVDSLTTAASPVPASSATDITCAASEAGLSNLTRINITVSGGTLPNGTTSQDVAESTASAAATLTWSTPPAGSYTISCQAYAVGGFYAGELGSTVVSLPVTVVAPAFPPPVVSSLTADASQVFPGQVINLSASVTGTGLTYAWSATGGTLLPSGATATWTAPAMPGLYTVTLVVTDAAGQSVTATVGVASAWAMPFVGASGGFDVPRRVAVDASGAILVTDSSTGILQVLSTTGQPQLAAQLAPGLGGVASWGDGRVLVTEPDLGNVRILDASLRPIGQLGAPSREFQKPVDVAVSRVDGRVYVADPGAHVVRVFDRSGAAAGIFAVAGTVAGIAVDNQGARVYVTDSPEGLVHVYDPSGRWLLDIGQFGTGPGSLSQAAGIAVGSDGNVYVVDAYQATVMVFTPAGGYVASVGAYSRTAGGLWIPIGIAADAGGRILVTSTQTGRVESFGLQGAQAPVCAANDSDCDGIPDWWEIKYGLNPHNPLDALADYDGDGLNNLQEYLHGTDPWNRDTDGDGYTDGEEVAMGTNPLDPTDHRPVLTAPGARTSPPGLVRLSPSIQSRLPCTYAWKQVAGPAVTVRGATTLTPSFAARAAGQYELSGTATCGPNTSNAASLKATVLNVAPRADAGPVRAVRAGSYLGLDGSRSSDANGDALAVVWDSTLGSPATITASGNDAAVRLGAPGLYGFRATATDTGGLQSDDMAAVLVLAPGQPAPTAAVAVPVGAVAGAPVTLDGSESVALSGGPVAYAWTQVAGPAVALAGDAQVTFTPPQPGRYAFELTVSAKGISSPPARAEVYVAGAAGLPVAAASAPATAAAGQPFELVGSASAGAVTYAWTQVSGPAAGLTDADLAVATVVAFDPGSYVFELSVVGADGAVSAPRRVRVDVAGASPLPVAVAQASIGRRGAVQLSAAGSTSGSGAPLRYEWTQVGGPWAALDGATAALARFAASLPATFTFELVVVDGAVRSAPARVGVEWDGGDGGTGGKPPGNVPPGIPPLGTP